MISRNLRMLTIKKENTDIDMDGHDMDFTEKFIAHIHIDEDSLSQIKNALLSFDDMELDKPHYITFSEVRQLSESVQVIQNPFSKAPAQFNQASLTCTICNAKFRQKETFESHKLSHLHEKQYECTVCHKKFYYPQVLKRHMRTHTIDKKFACEKCEYRCFSAQRLKEHQMSHDEEGTVSCEQCDKYFRDDKALKRHMLIHSDIGYACDICMKVYSRSRYLQRHKRRSHINVTIHECHCCEFATNNIKTYKAHVQKHADEYNIEKFKCNMCTFCPKNKQALVKHIYKVHNGKLSVSCDGCKKRFLTESCMERHKQLFHVETKYQCKSCLQYFTTKQGLQRHFKICPNKEKSLGNYDDENRVLTVKQEKNYY